MTKLTADQQQQFAAAANFKGMELVVAIRSSETSLLRTKLHGDTTGRVDLRSVEIQLQVPRVLRSTLRKGCISRSVVCRCVVVLRGNVSPPSCS